MRNRTLTDADIDGLLDRLGEMVRDKRDLSAWSETPEAGTADDGDVAAFYDAIDDINRTIESILLELGVIDMPAEQFAAVVIAANKESGADDDDVVRFD
jgi:hypothetical protein